jgi:hypothetical protein
MAIIVELNHGALAHALNTPFQEGKETIFGRFTVLDTEVFLISAFNIFTTANRTLLVPQS